MAMPDEWPDTISTWIRGAFPGHRLLYRPHPKKRRRLPSKKAYDQILDHEVPFADQARQHGVGLVVTYTSNAATDALLLGIPVLFCGPHIITEGAAQAWSNWAIRVVQSPIMLPDRYPAFCRLSWGQWRPDELRSGEAFRWILGI
jgi:hypothetical protein